MFNIRFIKTPPTTYVIHYKNGKIKREGTGLSFFYYAPTSTLAWVKLSSADAPFAFTETSADFQTVTLQGQLTYRVSNPKELASYFDLSVDAKGQYLSEDVEKLTERLIQNTQVFTRTLCQKTPLKKLLVSSDELGAEVLTQLQKSEAVVNMGIEILNVALLGIRPTPETARALEAEARENLQRQADEAIYNRRNAAVEQERRIKENELNTEIAVEEKKRQIRETSLAADISVEEQRKQLIEKKSENERKSADSQAYALEALLKPMKEMDWRLLMTLGQKGADPRVMIASAFQELAQNAQKIGELNISPDLLQTLAGVSKK